jgi:hypothetical protein
MEETFALSAGVAGLKTTIPEGRTTDRQKGHRGPGSGWRLGHQRNVHEFHCTHGPDQQVNENAPAYIFGIGYSFRLDGLL